MPALFCFACRLGLIWPRVRAHSRVEAEAEAFEGQNLVPITTASLQTLPRSSLLLHISCLCSESPAVVFSYRLISCTALVSVCGNRMHILSSRRQRWGEGGGGTENGVRVHTAAFLLFLYRIRVRRAGNPGNLVSSVWPVAVVSTKHYVLLYMLNFTHHIQFSTRYFVGVFF